MPAIYEANAILFPAGKPILRMSMAELAWLWLRYQSTSGLARWLIERVGTGHGRIR